MCCYLSHCIAISFREKYICKMNKQGLRVYSAGASNQKKKKTPSLSYCSHSAYCSFETKKLIFCKSVVDSRWARLG